MEVLVFHLVLLLREILANLVLQFFIAPVSIGVACFTKVLFGFVRVVLGSSLQVLVLVSVNPLKLEILDLFFDLVIWVWLPFQALLSGHHANLVIAGLFLFFL